MRNADAITVLTLAGDSEARKQAGAQAEKLAANLARHGLQAKVEAVETSGRSATDDIKARLDSDGADLLVMGCYGHSRLRELVFGGVTRDMLGNITVPTLLSH